MDPRVLRTKRSLQGALFDLARERPLDDITISDVVERADVNRSTFYQHYSDKETLLADALDAYAEGAGATLIGLDFPLDSPPPELVAYLRHLDENASLYRRVFADGGAGVAVARLRARIEAIVRAGLETSGAEGFDGMPPDVVAAGIAGSVLGAIGAWLAREPRPAVATAADWIWRLLCGPGDELMRRPAADAATAR